MMNYDNLSKLYPNLCQKLAKLETFYKSINFPIWFKSDDLRSCFYDIKAFEKMIELIEKIEISNKPKPVFSFNNLLTKEIKIYDYTTYRGKTTIDLNKDDLLSVLIIAYVASCKIWSCPFVLIRIPGGFRLIHNWNIYSKTNERKKPISFRF